MMEDCEGTPLSAVDACVEPALRSMATVRDVEEIKRLLSIPVSQRWCQPIYAAPEPGVRVDDVFGEAAEEVRRRWTSEAARDLLTRTMEAEADALSFPPAGSVWRSPSTTVEYAPNGRRWRLLFDDGPGEWCYDGIAEGWEPRDMESAPAPAPQAVTLEIATLNASDPAPYVSPSDVDLPRIIPGQVWRLSGLGRLEGQLVRVVRLSPPWAHVEIVDPTDDESCPPILVGIMRKWCALVETAPEVTDG